MRKIINITGMTCSACSNYIQKTFENKKGINYVYVNLVNKKMIIDFDEEIISLNSIEKNIKKIGYGVSKNNIDENYKNRLIISLLLTILLIYLALSFKYSKPLFFIFNNNIFINYSLQLVIASVIMMINYQYYSKGIKGLIKLYPNMESLISVSTLSAYLYSGYIYINILLNKNIDSMVDYMSIGMILTIITIGKYIQNQSLKRTNKALESLINLIPLTAKVLESGKEIIKNVDEININDIVIIKSGDIIPVDGIIVKGEGYVDESTITGEANYIEKNIGSKVLKSTLNQNGNFLVKTIVKSEDTMYNKIINMVEEASSNKSKVEKIVDKISRFFVPSVIMISFIAFFVWLIIKDFSFALSISSSILVISCPCALGLATPTAIVVSVYKAASLHILIKNTECFEKLANIKTILLDKTGTVTIGKMNVLEVVNINIDYKEFINLVINLERKSNHPISKSIDEFVSKNNIDVNAIEITDFNDIFGKGLSGLYKNKKLIAGNLSLMNDNKVIIDNELINNLSNSNQTIIYFSYNNEFIGYITLVDMIKETSKKAINCFKQMGINVKMITGDNKNTAKSIANQLDISDVYYEVLPIDKDNYVKKFQDNGTVCFIGDGINDTVALTRSDVGISMGNSTDIAIESSDVILMKNELIDVVKLLKLSKKTIRIIKENLFFAFIYNIILIPIACGILYNYNIFINATLSSLAMSMSSICVVLNALRINKFGGK